MLNYSDIGYRRLLLYVYITISRAGSFTRLVSSCLRGTSGARKIWEPLVRNQIVVVVVVVVVGPRGALWAPVVFYLRTLSTLLTATLLLLLLLISATYTYGFRLYGFRLYGFQLYGFRMYGFRLYGFR